MKLTDRLGDTGCPWDLARSLAAAHDLGQVASAITAALARQVRAGAAAFLLADAPGLRLVHAQGAPDLPQRLPPPGITRTGGRRGDGDEGWCQGRRDGIVLRVPTTGPDVLLVLGGPDIDAAWLEQHQGQVTDLVQLAVERALSRPDEEQAMTVLSHEMRTPLTTIKGYASSLLRDDVSWSPETIADYARLIDEETDVLIQMVSEVLEAGAIALATEPVLLGRLTRSVVAEVQRRDHRHTYVRSLPEDLPPVLGDPIRLRQVLANLLDNAAKYAVPGLVVVSAQDAGHEVVVAVADEGPGLKPEHLNRLFERYFRVKETDVAGTGLGLPLARSIIERFGGRIWATSDEGKGTTVSFSVPKFPEASGEAPSGEPGRDPR